MATERVTERTDGVTAERTVERTDPTVVSTPERAGAGGTGRLLITLAVIAVLAVLAFVLLRPMLSAEANKDNAVAGAAGAVEGAAESVGEAAGKAADAVTPDN